MDAGYPFKSSGSWASDVYTYTGVRERGIAGGEGGFFFLVRRAGCSKFIRLSNWYPVLTPCPGGR